MEQPLPTTNPASCDLTAREKPVTLRRWRLADGTCTASMAKGFVSIATGFGRSCLRLLKIISARMPGFFSRLFSCCSGGQQPSERQQSSLRAPLKPAGSPPQATPDALSPPRPALNLRSDVINQSPLPSLCAPESLNADKTAVKGK